MAPIVQIHSIKITEEFLLSILPVRPPDRRPPLRGRQDVPPLQGRVSELGGRLPAYPRAHSVGQEFKPLILGMVELQHGAQVAALSA